MADRVITPEAIISYPHLFEPQEPMDGQGKPKYGAVLIFPAGTDLSEMKRAAVEAAREKFGDKAPDVLRKAKNPTFRTDVEEKGYPEGATFLSARSVRQPGVVSTVPDSEGRPSVVTDPDTVYPGAIVRASIRFFGYDTAGNKGVGVALNNVQFVRDGERLDNYVPPEDEFDADPDAVADLGDLQDESAQEDDGDSLAELM